MKRRVVVTGLGCITPVGNTVQAMWNSLKERVSGVGPINYFDATSLPTQFASQVKNFQLADYVPDPERFQYSGRNIHFAIGAAVQAVKDAGLDEQNVEPTRFGVYLGSGEGQQDFSTFMQMIAGAQKDGDLDYAKFAELGYACLHPKRELEQEPNDPQTWGWRQKTLGTVSHTHTFQFRDCPETRAG